MNPTRIEVGGLGFSVDVRGEGDAVVLLHGFPDTSRVWREQIPALVEAGYKVIAPDLRGRGDSDIPEKVEDYAIPYLMQDVVGIMDALGVHKAAIVGHDWGSALAWTVATFFPDRVDRLTAISVGHPLSFSRRNARQLMMSWYMWIFAFGEGIAEELFTKDDWRIFREWAGGAPDSDEYIESLSKPGRLTAGLNWYRANITPQSLIGDPPPFPPVACPVLAVYSDHDFALSEKQMKDSADFVSGPFQYENVKGAGHWVQLERPDVINPMLLSFLSKTF